MSALQGRRKDHPVDENIQRYAAFSATLRLGTRTPLFPGNRINHATDLTAHQRAQPARRINHH